MDIRKSIKQEENINSGFIVTYNWLLCLPPAEAIMMAYLIDVEDISFIRDKEDLDFFECTSSFIISKCVGWSESNVKTCLNNLEDKNLIFTKNIRTNLGNSRFIKINRSGIKALKEQYEMKKHMLFNDKSSNSKTVRLEFPQS